MGSFAIVGAVFVLLTSLSWLRWPEVMVDFGREVYLPWQICAGKVLYRDLASYNGPLSPYFNAAAFWLAGVSIRTLIWVNLILLALCTTLVFNLLSGISSRRVATAGCVVFLAVFGFGHNLGLGNYNYVCPYAHEMTHGMLASLLAIFLFWQHGRRALTSLAAWSGVATGLVLLTKPELFVACFLTVAAGLGGLWLIDKTERDPRVRTAAAYLAGTVAPAGVAFGLFLTATSPRRALASAFGAWPAVFNSTVRSFPFYAVGVGAQNVGENSLRAVVWTLVLVAYLALVWGIGVVARGRDWPPRLTAWLCGTAGFAALSWFLLPRLWIGIARPLPLFLAVIGGFALVGVLDKNQKQSERKKNLLLLCLSIFSLLTLAKIVFTVYLGHYGFVLAMPGALTASVVMLERLPGRSAALGSSAAIVRAGGLALVAFVAVTHAGSSILSLRQKSAAVGEGQDRIMALPSVAKSTGILLALLDKVVAPGENLAVIPEGALLNYLARRPNPTPYMTLMPTEMAVYGELRILESFRTHPPTAILYAPRPGVLLGVGYLGTDYGRGLFDWIKTNYVAAALSTPTENGSTENPFVLLRRLPPVHEPAVP